jgi:hypothetical protein
MARYVIEDSGDGLFLEDVDTKQSCLIIKSIFCKLLGDIKIYSE